MLGVDPVLRITCSEVLQGTGPGQGQLESRGGVGLGGHAESSASLSSHLQFGGEKLGSISRQFPKMPDGPCSP